MPCSILSLTGCSDGGDIAGGVGFSAKTGLWPKGKIDQGKRGKRVRAHCGDVGMASMLGEASEAANRPVKSGEQKWW